MAAGKFLDTTSKLPGRAGDAAYTQVKVTEVATSSQILRKQRVCETIISPFDGELSKMHEAEVHVFSDSVLCMGKQAINEPAIKMTTR